MKSKLMLLAAIMMLGMTTAVLAEEEKADTTASMPMNMEDMQMDMNMDMGATGNAVMNKEEAAPTTGAVEVGNKICPVSGKEIVMDKKSTIEYNGKIYNLCCSMCKQDF